MGSRIIYEGDLAGRGVSRLRDRRGERLSDATALTRPHSLRLLDLGFYSSMIIGCRHNVRLSVAKLFSTPLKGGEERIGLNASRRLLHQWHSQRTSESERQTQQRPLLSTETLDWTTNF